MLRPDSSHRAVNGYVHFQRDREPSSSIPGFTFGQTDYFEKFLFYRGVGKFELPIKTVFGTDGEVSFHNEGTHPINAAVLIKVNGQTIQASELGATAANQSMTFGEPRTVTMDELGKLVANMLVAQDLYEKEALAMVETWKQSWFGEQGTRVLYIVPRKTTDDLLPLSIEPQPQETLRVLVGRMEVMSPDDERSMIEAVRTSSIARARFNGLTPEQKQAAPFEISQDVMRLGRMTEPALARISKLAKDINVQREAEKLLRQIQLQ